MLKCVTICSEKDREWLSSYLKRSSVPLIGEQLQNGAGILKKGTISSLEFLGNLITFTGEIDESAIIGPRKPRPAAHGFNGKKWYLVKEQIPYMGDSDIRDGGHIQQIKEYINFIQSKEQLEFIITTIHKAGKFQIVDGNKRTIAFYECYKMNKINIIDFKIFIIEGLL